MVEAKSALTRYQQEHVWKFHVVAATAYCAASAYCAAKTYCSPGHTLGLPLYEFTIPYAVWGLAWQARTAWALDHIRNWHIVDGTDSEDGTEFTYKYLVHTVNKPYDILGPIIAGVGSLGCGVFSVQMATIRPEYAIMPAVASVVFGTAFFAMFYSWVEEKQLAKKYETKCLTVE